MAETVQMDSNKMRAFVDEGLKDPATQEYKAIGTIGGIGKVASEKFGKAGFTKAYNLVGQFMVLGLDEELMEGFLEDYIGKSNYRSMAVQTCKRWCDQHL
eukprot:m.108908 g.108908  ORF g.108908 m.108908 type:complete len:100 (+) comp27915_c0_seq6:394-693(+)